MRLYNRPHDPELGFELPSAERIRSMPIIMNNFEALEWDVLHRSISHIGSGVFTAKTSDLLGYIGAYLMHMPSKRGCAGHIRAVHMLANEE